MRKSFVLVGVAALALLALSSPASAHSTSCNGTLSGQTISGDLVVPDGAVCTIVNTNVGDDVWVGENAFFQATGSHISDRVEGDRSQTVFIDTGTTVGGEVEANRTAQLFVYNSTIDGRVEAWRSSDKVQICGNTIDGKVQVHRSGPDILVGDPLTVGCAGNTVTNGHKVVVQDNFTDVELVVRGNKIQGGDLTVNDNSGPSDKFVQDNTGGDKLDCFGNEQPFTASGNTGWNDQRNQCAVPPTQCNGTLNGQTIPNDLVVPDDGSCTITNSTVGGDVKVGKNAFFQATGSQIGGGVKGKHSQTVFIDTGTTVGDDLRTYGTSQVFIFNATISDRLLVAGSDDKVQVCGTKLQGRSTIAHSGRDILIGDPQAVGCPGNTIANGHSLTVSDSFTDVEFVIRGNTFEGGDLRALDNQGPVEKFVQDNTGGDDLECSGNDNPFTASGNSFANEEGQCA
jgi:hypothetical protein